MDRNTLNTDEIKVLTAIVKLYVDSHPKMFLHINENGDVDINKEVRLPYCGFKTSLKQLMDIRVILKHMQKNSYGSN